MGSGPEIRGRPSAWPEAVRLVARWCMERERIDQLMERASSALTSPERARCQYLVFGVVRHFGRLEAALDRLIAHPPRFVTRALLFVAGYELIESAGSPDDAGHVPKIVHHAVEQAKTLASDPEARLVNAVVRKLAAALRAQPEPPRLASAEVLADYFSHPEWLVSRWLVSHGAESTRALLEWNQRPAAVHARWRGQGPAPDWLKPTRWEGFYDVPSGRWPDVEALLREHQVYLQDPAARLAVGLLAPAAGETVLDLCAAPGGKSLLIADAMGRTENAQSTLVAWDLPEARLDRLRQNLAAVTGVKSVVVPGDVLSDGFRPLQDQSLPTSYSAVLLDVPCSNTGVMRHRVDVKWRLQEGDFSRHPRQQLAFLLAASRLVAPGGRLVYSTCSIDPGENEKVAAAFLEKTRSRFALEAQEISTPWTAGHDGAAAFLFRASPG